MALVSRHEPLAGVLWMAVAAVTYSLTIILVRHLSATFSTFEIVFVRLVFGILFMLPWAFRVGIAGLRTRQTRIYAARAVLTYSAIFASFYSVRLITVADSIALQFTLPFFTLLLAIVILGERVRAHRWIATIVGFAGALIIIRPGFAEFNVGMPIALSAAALFAASDISTRFLSGRDSVYLIMFWGFVAQLPIATLPAVLTWVTPGPDDLVWLGLFAVFSILAQLFLTRAFAAAEASLVSQVLFLRLPCVAALGFVFFGELPSPWTWVGAAVLFGATCYGTRRDWVISRSEPARPA